MSAGPQSKCRTIPITIYRVVFERFPSGFTWDGGTLVRPTVIARVIDNNLESLDRYGISGESESVSLNQTEKLPDESSASDGGGSHSRNEPKKATPSAVNQTSTDVDQRGRAILVSTPPIAGGVQTSHVARKRN